MELCELPESCKGFVGEAVRNRISKKIIRNNINRTWEIKKQKIIKGLKKKDCFYLKADKGNKVVISDKMDYFHRVDKLIEEGQYRKLTRNPLYEMANKVKDTLNSCKYLIISQLKYKLQISNPTISKLYCLPKIHKPGKSMRPVVSAIGLPTYHISKWLVSEFEKLKI